MAHLLTSDMQAGIDDCLGCHVICLSHAIGRRSEAGDRHGGNPHLRLMLDCAEICRVAADFMARGSGHRRLTCRLCAEICRACAGSCQELGDLQEVMEACWRCAATCKEIAETTTSTQGDEE